jgi:glycosyltransferase involved in cell wall biosynthesis
VIHVLLPEIHARPTGGNLYNKRVFAALSRWTSIDFPSPRRAGRGQGEGLWLVDSLLIDTPIDGAILLAHYLHLIDPEHRESAKAAREREHLARYRAVIATSEYARDAFRDVPGIAIPPGLDDRYRAEVTPRRNATPLIVTVANFFPDKGLIDAIDVLESIRDLRWEWHLAGDASLDAAYARAFHERLARSAISQRVSVRGPLAPAKVKALYDRADIFLLLARFETCSMVTREAMARALPVVAYPAGGLASNLPQETRHLLAPLDDRDAIAATLRRLLDDADERVAAGLTNREAAMRFPTWDDAARELHAFLGTMPESHP